MRFAENIRLGISYLGIIIIGISCFSGAALSYKKKIQAHREEIDQKFLDPAISPLKELASTYKGQSYYAPNKSYRVKAQVELTPDAKPFKIPTSNPKKQKYFVEYAKLSFEIEGKKLMLSVYRNLELSHLPQYKNHLFLPFADATSGFETYGGGRYMDLEIPKGNKMILDFNLCYNPYCAYSDGWSCPIIPKDNFLKTSIRAGVKKYDVH